MVGATPKQIRPQAYVVTKFNAAPRFPATTRHDQSYIIAKPEWSLLVIARQRSSPPTAVHDAVFPVT